MVSKKNVHKKLTSWKELPDDVGMTFARERFEFMAVFSSFGEKAGDVCFDKGVVGMWVTQWGFLVSSCTDGLPITFSRIFSIDHVITAQEAPVSSSVLVA
jgi:hypothetical protein